MHGLFDCSLKLVQLNYYPKMIESLLLSSVAFSMMFSCALGAGWALPLINVYMQQAKINNSMSDVFSFLDIILIAFECIPLF